MKKELFIKKQKIIYIEIIRIIACFMVIINHTNGYILEYDSFINKIFYCITIALCRIGVPLFLMITGSLLLDKKYDLKKTIKNIFRVIVPVIGLSLVLYIKKVGFSRFDILIFLSNIIKSPYVITFWYVYALVGIYITMPFMQKMVKNFNKKDYIMFIILFLLIPSLIDCVKIYINFNFDSNLISAFFPSIIAMVVCGNYVSKIKLSQKKFVISIITFFLSFLIMFLTIYVPYLKHGTNSFVLESWNALPVVIMSISLFVAIRYLFEGKNISKRITNIINSISSTTFGIYLVHIFLIYKLYCIEIMQELFSLNAICGIVLLGISVFFVSMIIIYILKKIPIVKNFL